jgi:hypothetical protein
MSNQKYTRAVVNVASLHVNGLNYRPTRGQTVEGDLLAILLAKKADFSEDPQSGATLIWDLSSKAETPSAKKEVEKIEEVAAEIEAEMEAESEAIKAELEAAAEATGRSVKKTLSKANK